MSRIRPRPIVDLRPQSEDEMMNRVIRAKALLVLCGNKTLTLRTKDGDFEITPKLARKLLKESKN